MQTQNWDISLLTDNCEWRQKNREGRVIFRNTYFIHLGYTNLSCKENKQRRMPVPCSCPQQRLIAQGDIDFRTQSDYPHFFPQQAGILLEIIAFSLREKFVFITHVSFNIEQWTSPSHFGRFCWRWDKARIGLSKQVITFSIPVKQLCFWQGFLRKETA